MNRSLCSSFIIGMTSAAALFFSGCAQVSQPSYVTPDAAFDALSNAVRAGNTVQVEHLLGPGSDTIVHSGDAVEDKSAAQRFVSHYDEQHSVTKNQDGTFSLLLGSKGWPMPIPAVQTTDGHWRLDATRGKDEILNRRIGRNELDAIQTCLAIVDAQDDYLKAVPNGGMPVYADKFISTPGKKDGLYWPVKPGDPASPLGELVADATSEGYSTTKPTDGKPRSFHGYCFHMLSGQGANAPGGAWDYVVDGKRIGGFAVIAYPAEYGNSGIMSFIVNQSGALYQKDLGSDSASVARQTKLYNPEPGWTSVAALSTTQASLDAK